MIGQSTMNERSVDMTRNVMSSDVSASPKKLKI